VGWILTNWAKNKNFIHQWEQLIYKNKKVQCWFRYHKSKRCEYTLGRPKIPSAISRAKEPVDTTGTFLGETVRPSHIIDPFPNVDVIWSMACCKAKSFLDMFSSPESLPSDLERFLPSHISHRKTKTCY